MSESRGRKKPHLGVVQTTQTTRAAKRPHQAVSTAIQRVLKAAGRRHRRDERTMSQWKAMRHVGVQEVSKVVEGVQDWRKNIVDSAEYESAI
jgi:hypothetical protein